MQIKSEKNRRLAGRIISVASIVLALFTGILVLQESTKNPRTDDAEVFANFIGAAPVVSGPIVSLKVTENQQVKKGDLLLDIDEEPYAYALENAKSERGALEGQIANQSRTIASLSSAVDVAKANVNAAEAGQARASAAVDEAKANVANSKAAVDRAEAEAAYASNNLHRLEPLLARKFVTVDQIDHARTIETTRKQALSQAHSELSLAEASLDASYAQYKQSQAQVDQSHQQVQQATHAVTTLEPLTAERTGRSSAINYAQYNLDHCKYFAPFDGRVTNLTISEGAYAHSGVEIFTLIDTRTWWAVANFRETQLHHIRPGMKADVYVLSRPNIHYEGIVDSVGFGVSPDADIVGRLAPGLPDVQRTLNWVHLASRFPVRVRIQSGPNDLFRLSESAVVVIRGESSLSLRK